MSELNILHDCATIQLPKGLNTLVDADLYRLLNAMTWGVIHAKGEFVYPIHQVRRMGKLWSIKMHQFVADAPNGSLVDHRNRDTLDNRQKNLRVGSKGQNHFNAQKIRRCGVTSRFKGVSQRKTGEWVARITRDRKTVALGSFATEIEAAKAYDRAAREIHGEFALTNESLYGDLSSG